MSSTRSFKNPGIFAEDASTTIPPAPIAGVAYRDAVTGADDTPNGWRYGTRVESQDWNQVMFLLTSMMGMVDSQGVLGWSDQVDYAVPALVFGSNGLPYIALQASGPTTAAQDPVSAPLYWEQFALHGRQVFTSSGTFTVPMAMQLGYVKPFVRVIGGGGAGGANANGGGGGGGGGIAKELVDLFGVPSVTVTIGAGGAVSGASGVASSFGAFCSATGGGGASGNSGQDRGLGGIGSGGDISDTLGPGYQRITSAGISGKGGGPGGGASLEGGATPGLAATGYGCGGGGGTGGAAGGAGKAGIVIIEW